MTMNYLLLPDFFAMALLVTVLLMMRSKRSDNIITLWTAGLLLVLLECAARIVYSMPTSHDVHLVMHALALDAYGIAGALFLRSASRSLRRMAYSNAFVWANLVPHLALFTVYAFDLRQEWVYRLLVLLGLSVGFASSAILRRPWPYYAAFAVIWAPLLICTRVQQFRTAVYLSLFFLYLLSAIFFYGSLRKHSRGKIAVVAGFTMWALCFVSHPWISTYHPGWATFASEFWNMQKFVITVGLLLVMLEDQIRSNEWLALHDELTGLPNRRLFGDRLQHAVTQAARSGQRLALFNVDLDGFKQINDTMGHDAGDVLLQQVAKNLSTATRCTDTLARQGGDEFSLIAIELDGPGQWGEGRPDERNVMFLPEIERICGALMHAIEKPVRLGLAYDDAVVQVTGSIGVAVFPDDGKEPQALARLADLRMYRNKEERKAASHAADRAGGLPPLLPQPA
jgi:GGDEF domain-containing protein